MEAPKSKPAKQQQQAALSKQDSLEKGNSHEGFVDHVGDSTDDASAAGKGPVCSWFPPIALLVPWPPNFVPATHAYSLPVTLPATFISLSCLLADPLPVSFLSCLSPDHYPLPVPLFAPNLPSCLLTLTCAPAGLRPTLLPTTPYL